MSLAAASKKRRRNYESLVRLIRFMVWMQRWSMTNTKLPLAREIAEAHGVHMNTASFWRRNWLDARRTTQPPHGETKVEKRTLQTGTGRLEAIAEPLFAAMRAIQDEMGCPSIEVVAVALYVTGSALAQVGATFPLNGAIDEHLGPLAEGYRQSFEKLSKKHAN